MNGLICNAMLSSLSFFGKKENETWGKFALIYTVNDSTDVVAAIKAVTYLNKENALSALDGFV